MHVAALLLVLAANKPNFESEYFTKCYEREDADSCTRRQERWNQAMEQYRQELAEDRARELTYVKDDAAKLVVKPEPGLDVVKPLSPPWCGAAKADDEAGLSGLRALARNITNFNEARYFSFGPLLHAARAACVAKDNDDVKKLTAALVQSVVNVVGLSQADAIADVTARLDEEGLVAAKKKVCADLKPSDEAEGDAKAVAQAKWLLLGCGDDVAMDSGLWLNTDALDQNDTAYWLDTAEKPESQALLLASLLGATRNADALKEQPYRLLSWATAQLDLPQLDGAALEKELGADVMANTWAKLLVKESLGALGRQRTQYEAQVKAFIAKDEAWKDILVEAPKKAVADWRARAQQFQKALDESRAFERKALGPSRKAAKGCAPTLRAGFAAYLKTVSVKSPKEFSHAVVGDPVGSLLLQRLAVCEAAEGHPSIAGMLRASVEEGRILRGPRFAALYAAIEALGEVKKDRPKFAVDPQAIRVPWSVALMERFGDSMESVGLKSYEGVEGSVVKTVKPEGDKVRVVFITEKFTRPAHICVDTNRILRIEPNGTVLYYRNCTFGKQWETVTVHLEDAVIPKDTAAGIKPGTYVEVARPGAGAVPLAVYPDKGQAKLVAWRGFPL